MKRISILFTVSLIVLTSALSQPLVRHGSVWGGSQALNFDCIYPNENNQITFYFELTLLNVPGVSLNGMYLQNVENSNNISESFNYSDFYEISDDAFENEYINENCDPELVRYIGTINVDVALACHTCKTDICPLYLTFRLLNEDGDIISSAQSWNLVYDTDCFNHPEGLEEEHTFESTVQICCYERTPNNWEEIAEDAGGNFIYNIPKLQNSIIMNSESRKNPNSPVKISPNPFNSFINFIPNKEISSISIFDITGELLNTYNKGFEKISTYQYSKGLYFCLIEFLDGSKVTEKLIKSD